MSKKILIAYASVSGSTGEIAQAIGEVISDEPDITVQVSPVGDIVDVADYSAVVIGSSIRVGKWLPEAVGFLQTHQDALSQVPVAYFTTCLTMVDDTAENRRTVLAYMEPVLQSAPQIKPVALGLFAGSLDPARQMFMQAKAAPQGDYRDWAAIRSWAAEIRPALLAGEAKLNEPVVLRGAILSYTDMSSTDLREADLREANLHGAALRETDLREANLHEANLRKADLHQADLHGASLNWADMDWANMSGANLAKANLIGADLKRANLNGANLSEAILNGANLSEAKLSEANLSYTDLNWADLRGADLSQADLSNASLTWANLDGAILRGANLNNTLYNSQTQWPDDFSAGAHGAILVGGELH